MKAVKNHSHQRSIDFRDVTLTFGFVIPRDILSISHFCSPLSQIASKDLCRYIDGNVLEPICFLSFLLVAFIIGLDYLRQRYSIFSLFLNKRYLNFSHLREGN